MVTEDLLCDLPCVQPQRVGPAAVSLNLSHDLAHRCGLRAGVGDVRGRRHRAEISDRDRALRIERAQRVGGRHPKQVEPDQNVDFARPGTQRADISRGSDADVGDHRAALLREAGLVEP